MYFKTIAVIKYAGSLMSGDRSGSNDEKISGSHYFVPFGF